MCVFLKPSQILYTPEEFLESEITYEQALKDDILDKLTDLGGEALRKLKDGC